MEKETRIIRCPKCVPEVTRIRIKVTVETYGKTIRIHCRKCLEDFDVEIPVPAAEAPEPPTGEPPFADAYSELFGDWFKPKK